jgi:hypothetical protein
MLHAPRPVDNVRRLALLPPPRRKAAAALLDVLRHRPGIDLVISLEPAAYVCLDARGIGPLAVERALLDLLATGDAEAAPCVAPVVTIRASGGAAG